MKFRSLPSISLIAFLSFQLSAYSQPFTLLKDINPGQFEKQAVSLTATNGQLFFILRQTNLGGYPSDFGKELWKTDGTNAGTLQLKELNSIPGLTAMNNVIYLFSLSPGIGSELWKSDGTAAGTVLVKSLAGSVVRTPAVVNNQLYFSVSGNELWKSDGTEAGTLLVKSGVDAGNLTNVNGTLFFSSVVAGPTRNTLWKSDGTEAGTVIVKDAFPGSSSQDLSNFFSTDDILLFSANTTTDGTELWKSDGTEAGTFMVKDIEPGSNGSFINGFTESNGTIFFAALNTADGHGLWKTDGTNAGTVLIKAFDGWPAFLVDVNNDLFFAKRDAGTSIPEELWKSDGSAAGTVLVKDFSSSPFNYMGSLVDVNGTLYFEAGDDVHGNELWTSDGTAAGTQFIFDLFKGTGSGNIQWPIAFNGSIFFTANNGILGREIWKSNGTTAGTAMVKDISFPTPGSEPGNLSTINNTVYFSALDPYASPGTSRFIEFFKTDGTLSGTNMISDINRFGSSLPQHFTSFGGDIYFSADNSDDGSELWKSDGSTAGTAMLKNINPFTGTFDQRGSDPSGLTVVNTALFFSATDVANGRELWKTDGTETGTVMVKNINPAAASSDPTGNLNLNGTLFFVADDGVNGRELWKSDGTDAGTLMVKNINPGGSSEITNLDTANGILYFSANDGTNGAELWKSDGTNAGTVMVSNINAGAGSNPDGLVPVNGILYFSADNGVSGTELWKTDGTAACTTMVMDIFLGPAGSAPASLTKINDAVYFSADNGTEGRELWRSDGTTAGTILIKDILPGVNSSIPTVLTNVNNNLLFAANDGINGNEVWFSNGSELGTKLMQDIEPGINGSDPATIIQVNSKVLVVATASLFGSELWVAEAPAESPLPLQLLEFRGSVINKDGYLQWKTDNESNTAAFLIERSFDGKDYKTIGTVTAANSPGIHHYDFTDADIFSLSSSAIYYRLKQTDIDGKFTYSHIVRLALNDSRSYVMLYPNPVKNTINLTINTSQKEQLNWQLVDNTGRIIKNGRHDLTAASTALTIDANDLKPGMYFMRLNGETLRQVIKLIKQ